MTSYTARKMGRASASELRMKRKREEVLEYTPYKCGETKRRESCKKQALYQCRDGRSSSKDTLYGRVHRHYLKPRLTCTRYSKEFQQTVPLWVGEGKSSSSLGVHGLEKGDDLSNCAIHGNDARAKSDYHINIAHSRYFLRPHTISWPSYAVRGKNCSLQACEAMEHII